MISGVLVCFYWLISFVDALFVVSPAFRETKKGDKKGFPTLAPKKLCLEWLFLAQRGGIIIVQLIIGPVVEKVSLSNALFVVVGTELLGYGIGAALLFCDVSLLYFSRVSRTAILREIKDAGDNTILANESNTDGELPAISRHHVISLKHIVPFDCATAFILGVLYSLVSEAMKDIVLVVLLIFLFCVSPLMLILSVYFRKKD